MNTLEAFHEAVVELQARTGLAIGHIKKTDWSERRKARHIKRVTDAYPAELALLRSYYEVYDD